MKIGEERMDNSWWVVGRRAAGGRVIFEEWQNNERGGWALKGMRPEEHRLRIGA
jgi:hypothetical protein